MEPTLPIPPPPPGNERAPEWARWAAGGCGLFVLLMLAVLVWSTLRADRFVDWGLRRLVGRVVTSLPEGVPQPARDELQRKLDCALAAAAAHQVTPSKIGELARACTDALADKQVSMTELEDVDRVAGAICAQARERTETPK